MGWLRGRGPADRHRGRRDAAERPGRVPGVQPVSPRPQLTPWQLWVVDFGTPIGHEQGGKRPAIIVGSAVHCGFHIDMALVSPLTTRDRGWRHHARIDAKTSGLRQASWARTEEITSVSTIRFGGSPIGKAAPAEIAELRQWLPVMVAF